MKHLILVLISFLSFSAMAQDSTKKVIHHEIGFNTVSLIKQLISNNPSSTLPQLPYDVFYNLYYKDLVGFRLGAGYNSSYNETKIDGQTLPRTLNQSTLSLRYGVSYNFVQSGRVTMNAFADMTRDRALIESSNTSTTQVVPNPITTITQKTTDEVKGLGLQLGVGLKYNLTRHISVYAEVPFTFVKRKTLSSTYVNEDGDITEDHSSVTSTISRIIAPTTLYLVLRF